MHKKNMSKINLIECTLTINKNLAPENYDEWWFQKTDSYANQNYQYSQEDYDNMAPWLIFTPQSSFDGSKWVKLVLTYYKESARCPANCNDGSAFSIEQPVGGFFG